MSHSLSSQKISLWCILTFLLRSGTRCCAPSRGLRASLAAGALSSLHRPPRPRCQRGGPGKSTLNFSFLRARCCSSVCLCTFPGHCQSGSARDPLALYLMAGPSWHQPQEQELHKNPYFRDLEIKVFLWSFSNLKQADVSFLGHMLET